MWVKAVSSAEVPVYSDNQGEVVQLCPEQTSLEAVALAQLWIGHDPA